MVIDCDFKPDDLVDGFRPGLTEWITDQVSLEEVTHSLDGHNFSLIASGKVPPDSSLLLGSNSFRTKLEDLKKSSDYIIFDCSPAIVMADTMAVAKLSDGIIFVVDVENSNRKWALEAARELRGKILGLVINNVPRPSIKSTDSSLNRYFGHGGKNR